MKTAAIPLLASAVAFSAPARSVTGIECRIDDSMQFVANVSLEAGAAGDDHALYLAFDTEDRGADPAAWAACQRVGRVAAGAWSRAIRLSPYPDGTVVVVR